VADILVLPAADMLKNIVALTPEQLVNLSPDQLAQVEHLRAYARSQGIV
jgi:hypothetical protein